ncbi:MAG: hypothetical protein QOD03_580 [Verrucomicrobiota bacterium]
MASPLSGIAQDAGMPDNAPPPEVAEQNLENAPGKIISTPASALGTATNVNVSPAVAEIVKLVQAGVDESVLLSFATNSGSIFDLSSDDIVYLNDIGVPGSVVTAMIQHDQVLKANPAYVQSQQPQYPTQPLAPGGTAPYQNADVAPEVTAPLTPPTELVENPPNPSATYFYDSLSPYGNWVQIEGAGLCWQPSTVVINREWQPYGDHGHWVYSDCGWYWVSDYSWGWAPFHYGRWFRNSHWGWCWAPDTVWGPSWVSWRYADDYCGWAPLPPTACYRPGGGFTYYGASVGISFGFGLSVGHYTFVPTGRFCDPHPYRYRADHRNVTKIYNKTIVVNQIVSGNNNTVINKGIPVDRVARASHTKIETMRVRNTDDPTRIGRGERVDRNSRTVSVYQPKLPTPTTASKIVGQGVRPASREERTRNREVMPAYNRRMDQQTPGTVDSNRRDRQNNPSAITRNNRDERLGNQRNETAAPNRNVSQSDRSVPNPINSNRANDRNDNKNQGRNIIMRGDPSASRNQAVPQVQPTQPIQNPNLDNRNRRSEENQNRRQDVTPQTPANVPQSRPAPVVQPDQSDRENRKVLRQEQRQSESPARIQREDRVVTPPLAPVQRQPETRSYQPSPAVEPRSQPRENPQSQRNVAPQIVSPRQADNVPANRGNNGNGNGNRGDNRDSRQDRQDNRRDR